MTIFCKPKRPSRTSREQAVTNSYESAIERIPHVTKKITLLWGSRELDALISRLIFDARDGSRQGFPVDVAAELLFLIETNKIIRAIETAQKLKIKLGEAYRMVDAGDQEALTRGDWQDPLSVSEAATISRRDSPRANDAPAAASAEGGGLLYWFGRLVLFLLSSKPFWFIAATLLTIKLMATKMGIKL